MLATEVVTHDSMSDFGKLNTRNWYAHGGLGIFLDTYEDNGTLEAHNEFLEDKPVANWIATYHSEWAIDLDRMELIFIDGEVDDDEVRMPITAKITHIKTKEVLYHSMMASSFVFRLNEDGSVTGLYLD